MVRRFALTLLVTVLAMAAMAQETPNAQQARRVFNKAYAQVFGPQGATLRYDVNIIGIYKTHGTIWYKGNKQKFIDEKVNTWNDGVTAYMAYRKKHVVEIHNAHSDKKDKYSGKFKFTLDDFNYAISEDGDNLLLSLKQKKRAKGTIKEVQAWVKRGTFEPIRLRIKVAFVWTTVNISNFKSGNISDDMFIFPTAQYKDWKFIDKRQE